MTLALFQICIAFFIGLTIVFYAVPIIVRISITKHLFDVPNDRRINKTVVPNLGGIALFAAISIGSLIGILKNEFPDWRFISSSMIILFFIGIKDDIIAISALKKFTAQILSAAIIIILGDIRLTNFHGILGIHEINYSVSVIVSLLAIVGTINAINLIDGIDGLASSIGILSSLVFGIIFFQNNQINYSVICFATLGSLVSFFVFNVFGKTNKIFMGDTGSLLLGLLLSIFTIKYNEMFITAGDLQLSFSPVFSLAILAIPLSDMIRLFIIRMIQKKSPFAADLQHIHHKILKIGFSHLETTLIIVAANLFILGIAFITRSLNNNISILILISSVAILSIIPRFAYGYIKSNNRLAYRKIPAKKRFSDFRYDDNLVVELSPETNNENFFIPKKPGVSARL